ncbi:ATP-binding protein [Sporomusa acidovorans]|uniref:histidine kinase n=1 Tax=Sporomusa acidovorans (strain ATCC 49682 / DSM 3132 / Mol) TaxID=1123286 RepID=A0ABZ3J5D6_SPOA4|nr:ATP-binding protein [Sporomusa acidovorans]OZC16364.1 alkaline phosphatase synthesis sensor protein PhoR [Sporomusa acidovorans DSM 3132]SDF00820.1 His Kinase A (phospho-acceptor) domain-containing protein [Sporomusa acidovorans]
MKSLSIRAHLWIAFAVIPMIMVVFLSILQLMQTHETSLLSTFFNIGITLVFTLLLGYFPAKRITNTIKILAEYIQEVMSEGCEIKPAKFPRFAPREFQMMAEHFCLLAQKTKEGQQALLKLNAELEQRVAERTASLQRTNQELAILNQLNNPVIPSPGGGDIIRECLQQFFEISGVTVKLYLTKPVFSLLSPYNEDMSGIDDEAMQRPRHKNAYRYYIQPIRSGNTTLGHLVVSNCPLSQADKSFLESLARYAGVIIQKEMLSQTLQKHNAVLKAVLESLNDAITLVDNRQEVAYANGRMAQLLDIPCDKLRGLPEEYIFGTLACRMSDADRNFVMQARQNYGIYKFKLTNGDGQRYMMLSAFPVISDKKYTIGKGFVFWDVTKDQEIDKLKSDLISMVSHEFKTPITSIKGSVETLLRVDAEWEEDFKREMLTAIHEDIDRIQELVNDWLDISRIDAKAIGLDREPVRPSIVVENAIKKLPKHFASGVTIESTVEKNLPFIYGDRIRLAQVLLNLFTNAIRYNERYPHIKILASYDERYVHISVADNGIGINKEHIDKVFDRFYCVDNGRLRPSGSTGLGLAICKGIVEAHGGSISVESDQDSGSVFTISIPQYNCDGDKDEEK